MKPEPVTGYLITPHAAFEMQRRQLSEETVRLVLAAPEQRWPVRPNRVVLQSRIPLGSRAKTYLVRVFVDVDRYPAEVVTVYRTKKIEKYWRGEQ